MAYTPPDGLAEPLTEAAHTAQLRLDSLRGSVKHATPTECLLLLPLIERAASLLRDLNALRDARAMDA